MLENLNGRCAKILLDSQEELLTWQIYKACRSNAGMEKDDARSLKPEHQNEMRKVPLRMRLNGHTYSEIAAIVGEHMRLG